MTSVRLQASLLSLMLFFWTALARAQIYTGPAASADGGAGRASLDAGESFFLNPATLTQFHQYFGSVHFTTANHPVEGSETTWAAAIADGSPDKIMPGAISVVQKKVLLPSGFAYTQTDYMASVAEGFGKIWSLGVAAHRLIYSDNNGGDGYQDNGIVGLLCAPNSNLGLALVGTDLLQTATTTPNFAAESRTYSLGVQYITMARLHLLADLQRPQGNNPGDRINYSVGLESFFRENLIFRSGFKWREVEFEERVFTVGLGFRGPKLSVDYAFQKDTLVSGGTRHSFDLWMPF